MPRPAGPQWRLDVLSQQLNDHGFAAVRGGPRLISFAESPVSRTSSEYDCPCCVAVVDRDHPDFFDGSEFMSSVPTQTPARNAWACAHVSAVGAAGTDCDAAGRVNVVGQGMQRFEVGKVAPPQPNWERLSDNVVCVLGQNPSSMTLNGTNCYLVGTGRSRLLIDTGEDSESTLGMMDYLEEAMAAEGVDEIQEIIVTHMHHDHFGGVAAVQQRFGPGIPVAKMASPEHYFETIRQLQQRGLIEQLDQAIAATGGDEGRKSAENGDDGVAMRGPEGVFGGSERVEWDSAGRTKDEIRMDYWYMKRAWEFHSAWQTGVDVAGEPLNWGACHEIVEGEVIETEGATLRCLHTPGHAEDHCSFYIEEDGALFSGDQVLGFGTTFQQDLYDYMRTLHRMLALQPTRLYPGHGPTIDNSVDFLSRYISHRQAREDQVYAATKSLVSTGTMALVRAIYTSTAEEKLWMARENVEKVMRKMEKEDRVWAWLKGADGRLDMYRFPAGFVRRYPDGLICKHPSALPCHEIALLCFVVAPDACERVAGTAAPVAPVAPGGVA
jgi:glyoxylase-like metal-dependent hydrolase (beta-lactamase superfamily II)